MRASRYLLATLRETPADAEVISHQLMLRAGVINVFDRHPPALPETFNGTGVGASQYDNRGRFVFVGAGLNF